LWRPIHACAPSHPFGSIKRVRCLVGHDHFEKPFSGHAIDAPLGAAMALGEVALYLKLLYVHPDPPAVTRGQTIGGEPAGFGGAD